MKKSETIIFCWWMYNYYALELEVEKTIFRSYDDSFVRHK